MALVYCFIAKYNSQATEKEEKLVRGLSYLQKQREESGFRDALAKACASMGQAAREGRASKGERGLIEALEVEVFSSLNTAITAEVNRRGKPKKWRSAAIEIDTVILARLAIRGFASIVSASPAPNLKTVLQNMGHSMVLALSLAREDYEGALTRQENVGQLRRTEVSKIRKKLRADQKTTPDDVDTWEPADLCKMGVLLWDALVSCDLVRAEEVSGKKVKKKDVSATHLCVIPSEHGLAAWERVKDTQAFRASVAPTLRPMLAPPRDWTGFKSGGYLTRVGSTALVRSASPVVRAAITKATNPIKKPVFLKALNALQAVPLRINKDALWLREYVWDSGIHIQGQTPNRTKVSVPDFPTEEDGHDRPTLYRLRAERRKRINANRSIGSLEQQWRIDSAEAIELHTRHETEGLPFYLPHGMDYRGRIYATPSFSHQRGDQVKGLFEFFHGQPLGVHGLDGLKIQVANTCDFDKISKESFKERIAWVDAHMDMLEAMVDDPERFRVWARPDCDAPFSFFAAACDLVRAVRSGNPEEYVSHIRVDLDGSNSGVQHYAAATRALEGIFVSLYPTQKPQDLYNIVAKRVMVAVLRDSSGLTTDQSADPARTVYEAKERLKEIARRKKAEDRPYEEHEKAEIEHLKKLRDRACAAQWASYGVSRSTVKRSVMTYSYSSEAYGFGQHINEDLMEPLARDVMHGRLAAHPFGADEGFAAASYLGRKVFAAVEEVLPNVAQAMRWLKSVGATQGKAGKPLRMTTRDGFPLTFEVHEQEVVRVSLDLLLDVEVKRRFRGDFHTDAAMLSPGKMSSGAAPQVIHACDATHLRMVVGGLLEEGISDFQTIHDSFGVHAANWRTLSHVCKEQMVWLYADWSPFTAMEGYEGAPFKLAKPGGLDLKKVLRSEYAFS